MRNKILASTILGILAIGVKADVITQEQSYSAETGWAQNLTFNQFNPQLGTLNGVTIDLTGNAELATSVNNNGVGALNFSIGDDFVMDGYIPGGPLTLTKELDQSFLVGLGATAGDTTSGSVSQNETLSGDLSAWEGLGSIVLPADANGSASYNVDAGNTVNATGTVGLTATVSYDYTAVPEGPLPLWAAMSGFLGVFWYAAKQKKHFAA